MPAYRLSDTKIVFCGAMTFPQSPPKTIGELIDELERIQQDLFHLQHELEKIEIVEIAVSGKREEV